MNLLYIDSHNIIRTLSTSTETINIIISITKVEIQKAYVSKLSCRYTNKFLKCHKVLGLTCIKNTAKQDMPNQLTTRLCILNLVK